MTRTRIGQVRDSEGTNTKKGGFNVRGNVRILKVNSNGAIQNVQLLRNAGEDVNPPNESIVIVLEQDFGFLYGIAVDDLIEPSVAVGEKKIYASDAGGNILGYVHLLANGRVKIANQYQNLYTILNGLLNELQTFAAACHASSTDPTLVSAATALSTALGNTVSQLGGLLE